MGKVFSVVQRKINRFNVENRAHKIISKDKPTPAPMYPQSREQLDNLLKEHPEIVELHEKKDSSLNKRLKDVYVTSEDPEVHPDILKKREVQAALPQDRHTTDDPEFGFYEPAMIPHGRITLRQALKFITDHQQDPKTWSTESIANQYNLSQKVTDNILQHFHAFEVYIPNKEDSHTKIAEPLKKKISGEGGKLS